MVCLNFEPFKYSKSWFCRCRYVCFFFGGQCVKKNHNIYYFKISQQSILQCLLELFFKNDNIITSASKVFKTRNLRSFLTWTCGKYWQTPLCIMYCPSPSYYINNPQICWGNGTTIVFRSYLVRVQQSRW